MPARPPEAAVKGCWTADAAEALVSRHPRCRDRCPQVREKTLAGSGNKPCAFYCRRALLMRHSFSHLIARHLTAVALPPTETRTQVVLSPATAAIKPCAIAGQPSRCAARRVGDGPELAGTGMRVTVLSLLSLLPSPNRKPAQQSRHQPERQLSSLRRAKNGLVSEADALIKWAGGH